MPKAPEPVTLGSAPDLLVLRAVAGALGVALNDAMVAQFAGYFRLLAEHGARVNLSSVLDIEGVQRRHFGESLAVGVALRGRGAVPARARVLDVGSGAGFPGLPLRIAWPELRITLLEATGKKARFLQTVADELNVKDVQIVNARAEEAAHDPALRGRFDLVLARAVAPLGVLAELTLPFAAIGGRVAAVKGSRLAQELAAAGAAIRQCGGGAISTVRLPEIASSPPMSLVLIEKEHPTPPHLPRSPGLPAARPLR